MTSKTTILVTGASGGIGSAAALECANRGASIGIHYNSNLQNAEMVLALGADL